MKKKFCFNTKKTFSWHQGTFQRVFLLFLLVPPILNMFRHPENLISKWLSSGSLMWISHTLKANYDELRWHKNAKIWLNLRMFICSLQFTSISRHRLLPPPKCVTLSGKRAVDSLMKLDPSGWKIITLWQDIYCGILGAGYSFILNVLTRLTLFHHRPFKGFLVV